jgi:hypothetical protein
VSKFADTSKLLGDHQVYQAKLTADSTLVAFAMKLSVLIVDRQGDVTGLSWV